jgi:DNA (cytosine-5)-methyltransferase 1
MKIVNELTFYSAAIVNGDMRILVGGHVTIEPNDSNVPIYIAEL